MEQAAFNPANVVAGHQLLAGPNAARALVLATAMRSATVWRVNHNQIPVNAPRCPVHSYHRDGAMRMDGNSRQHPGL